MTERYGDQASLTTTGPPHPGRNRNTSALGYMLIASITNSVIPLVVHLAGASHTPFLFNVYIRAGVAVGCLLFLIASARMPSSQMRIRDILRIQKHIIAWPHNKLIIIATVGSLDYGLFALSTRFIQIPVSTILFEMYPVGIILAASWLFRSTGRYQGLTPGTAPPIILSLAGLVFANTSQLPGFSALTPGFLWTSLTGITLVALAIISASLSVCGLRWAADLSTKLPGKPNPRGLELEYAVIAFLVVSLISIPISLGAGLTLGESINSGAALAWIIGGAAANAAAAIVWRKAILITDNLGINAVGFITPVLSILWLYWVAHANVARWDYLLIGATAIITANLWIKLQASRKAK